VGDSRLGASKNHAQGRGIREGKKEGLKIWVFVLGGLEDKAGKGYHKEEDGDKKILIKVEQERKTS